MNQSKQYVYTFSLFNGLKYKLVASRYEQARSFFKKMVTADYIVIYGGRYYGPEVRNGSCVAVISQ